MDPKKQLVWIFAGESSGDLYGAELAKSLISMKGDQIHIAGMGGDAMKNAGVDIMVDSSELGIIGFVEVFKHIFTFINIFNLLLKRAEKERPSVVVLIDYPGFNLRFAKKLKKLGIPVVWYICPQVWSWGKKRIPVLAHVCRKMMAIFPFEPDFLKGSGMDVEFVGHPLVKLVQKRQNPAIQRDLKRVLLLPGSRRSEVDRLFTSMLETVSELSRRDPSLTFVVSAPREKIYNRLQEILKEYQNKWGQNSLPNIEMTCGDTARWLQEAGTGLAASGTVTVECAISGLPLVSIYRLNSITFMLARCVVKLFRNYFTMVNIIANRTVYEEFIQKAVCAKTLVPAMERILPGGSRRDEVIKDIQWVTEQISGGADPSNHAASVVISVLDEDSAKS